MNDTTLLLGLPDVVVDRVELDPDGTRVVRVSLVRGALNLGEGVGHDRAT